MLAMKDAGYEEQMVVPIGPKDHPHSCACSRRACYEARLQNIFDVVRAVEWYEAILQKLPFFPWHAALLHVACFLLNPCIRFFDRSSPQRPVHIAPSAEPSGRFRHFPPRQALSSVTAWSGLPVVQRVCGLGLSGSRIDGATAAELVAREFIPFALFISRCLIAK